MTTSLRPFWDWTPRAIGSFRLLVGRSCEKSMYSSCQIWALTLSDRWRSIGTTLEVKVPVTADAADAIVSPTASVTAMLGVSPPPDDDAVGAESLRPPARPPATPLVWPPFISSTMARVARFSASMAFRRSIMVANIAVAVGASSWVKGDVEGPAVVSSCLRRFEREAVALATPRDAFRFGGIPATTLTGQQTQCWYAIHRPCYMITTTFCVVCHTFVTPAGSQRPPPQYQPAPAIKSVYNSRKWWLTGTAQMFPAEDSGSGSYFKDCL